MQFVTSHEGETLPDLVQRLYCQASDAERRRIATLVREANPDLATRKDIPKGTVVIIPQVEGIEPASDVRTERQIAASLIHHARGQIGDLGPILSQLVDLQEKEAQETLKLTKSRDVRKLAKEEEFVRDRLADVSKDVGERLKRNKALRDVTRQAKRELESDLDELLKMLDPQSAPPNSKRPKRQRK